MIKIKKALPKRYSYIIDLSVSQNCINEINKSVYQKVLNIVDEELKFQIYYYLSYEINYD